MIKSFSFELNEEIKMNVNSLTDADIDLLMGNGLSNNVGKQTKLSITASEFIPGQSKSTTNIPLSITASEFIPGQSKSTTNIPLSITASDFIPGQWKSTTNIPLSTKVNAFNPMLSATPEKQECAFKGGPELSDEATQFLDLLRSVSGTPRFFQYSPPESLSQEELEYIKENYKAILKAYVDDNMKGTYFIPTANFLYLSAYGAERLASYLQENGSIGGVSIKELRAESAFATALFLGGLPKGRFSLFEIERLGKNVSGPIIPKVWTALSLTKKKNLLKDASLELLLQLDVRKDGDDIRKEERTYRWGYTGCYLKELEKVLRQKIEVEHNKHLNLGPNPYKVSLCGAEKLCLVLAQFQKDKHIKEATLNLTAEEGDKSGVAAILKGKLPRELDSLVINLNGEALDIKAGDSSINTTHFGGNFPGRPNLEINRTPSPSARQENQERTFKGGPALSCQDIQPSGYLHSLLRTPAFFAFSPSERLSLENLKYTEENYKALIKDYVDLNMDGGIFNPRAGHLKLSAYGAEHLASYLRENKDIKGLIIKELSASSSYAATLFIKGLPKDRFEIIDVEYLGENFSGPLIPKIWTALSLSKKKELLKEAPLERLLQLDVRADEADISGYKGIYMEELKKRLLQKIKGVYYNHLELGPNPYKVSLYGAEKLCEALATLQTQKLIQAVTLNLEAVQREKSDVAVILKGNLPGEFDSLDINLNREAFDIKAGDPNIDIIRLGEDLSDPLIPKKWTALPLSQKKVLLDKAPLELLLQLEGRAEDSVICISNGIYGSKLQKLLLERIEKGHNKHLNLGPNSYKVSRYGAEKLCEALSALQSRKLIDSVTLNLTAEERDKSHVAVVLEDELPGEFASLVINSNMKISYIKTGDSNWRLLVTFIEPGSPPIILKNKIPVEAMGMRKPGEDIVKRDLLKSYLDESEASLFTYRRKSIPEIGDRRTL
jgi:hypothetical protein